MKKAYKISNLPCRLCHITKSLDNFFKNQKRRYGYVPDCKTCINERSRNHRKSNNNKNTKKYERTFKGHLVRTYRNMLSRVTGVQKRKAHLYKGLSILSKKDFYKWSENCPIYKTLFDEWQESNYIQILSPSIDRIDSSVGYDMDNMQWLTHSKNSSKATIERFKLERATKSGKSI